MKKVVLSVVVSIALLQAGTLQKGWSMVSTKDTMTSSITDEKIKAIWSYSSDSNWSAYSPNSEYAQALSEANIQKLTNITKDMGVWIQTTDEITTELLDKSYTTNTINIKSGWSLIGTIDTKTSINQIDPNALYWTYKNNKWYLGENKISDIEDTFLTISNSEGFWIYSSEDINYTENLNDKYISLHQDLTPKEFSSTNSYTTQTNIVSKDKNHVIFIEDENLAEFSKDSSDAIQYVDFRLSDYFFDFYDVDFIAIEARPVTPALIGDNLILSLKPTNLKQSITVSMENISTAPDDLAIGSFITGFEMIVQGSDKNTIPLDTLNNQAQLKPIFENITSVTNPFLYLKNSNSWELVGPLEHKNSDLFSTNWSDKFGTFAVIDLGTTYPYNYTQTVKNQKGQHLKDVVIVSDTKLITTTDYNGMFVYNAPKQPTKLIAYKDGYMPKLIDTNSTSSIVLETIDNISLPSGVNISYDENLSLIYVVGDDLDSRFEYSGDDLTIVPKLIATTDKNIYSSVYSYDSGYIFAGSDSTINSINSNKTVTKIKEGDGLIYDGLYSDGSDVYIGTLGDTMATIDGNSDKALSEAEFLDEGLSVIYKPITTTNNLYIPIYNRPNSSNVSMIIKTKSDFNNLLSISEGTAGKLSKIENDIVFGTKESKVVFVDTTTNSENVINFDGEAILSNVVKLDSHYFAIDLDGTLKKFTKDGTIIDTIQMSASSNIIINGTNIIVSDLNGTVSILDSSLNLSNAYSLDSTILATPIVYNSNIYTITKNGTLYKNDTKIGTFQSKVTNINLISNKIVFGTEDGEIWEISL